MLDDFASDDYIELSQPCFTKGLSITAHYVVTGLHSFLNGLSIVVQTHDLFGNATNILMQEARFISAFEFAVSTASYIEDPLSFTEFADSFSSVDKCHGAPLIMLWLFALCGRAFAIEKPKSRIVMAQAPSHIALSQHLKAISTCSRHKLLMR